MTPDEAFQALKDDDYDGVHVLLKHLDSRWKAELMDWISSRMTSKGVAKTERLLATKKVARFVFTNASSEALVATRYGYFNNLADMTEEFGCFLRYWLLYAVIDGKML